MFTKNEKQPEQQKNNNTNLRISRDKPSNEEKIK